MTVHAPSPPEAEPASDDVDQVAPLPRRRLFRKRRPGPPASFAWRWVYPVVLVGLIVATVALSISGGRMVLNSRDGKFVNQVRDPSKPGYAATVTATPTVLVVQTGDDGAFVSAVVMTLAAQEAGGWALLLPAELVVPTGDGTKTDTLAKIFAQRGADGTGGLRSVLGRLLGASLDSVVQADASAIDPLIGPVAPIRMSLTDPVRVKQNGATTTLLKAGPVEISTERDVSAVTEVQGVGEVPIVRYGRQVKFWTAWIDAVRAVPDKAAAFPAGSESTVLARFVKGLASGATRIEQAPFSETGPSNAPQYVLDAAKLQALALQMIPYPLSYEPGARVRVDVRNGVGNLDLNEPMNRKLVAAGSQIIVLGNAPVFGVARTSVVYYDAAMKDRAAQLARVIGATDVRFEEQAESSIDVTVTIGADFVP